MPYATVAQLREYVSQVQPTAEKDAQLQAVLDRAHQIVDEALGIEFADWGATATAKDVRGSGEIWLELPAYEEGSIESVYEVYGRGLDNETTEEVTEYVVEDDGRLYYGYTWPASRWYRVTAKWGYGPAPASVVECELEVAVNLWQGKTTPNWSQTAGAEGGGAVTINRALTWAQRSILEGVRARYEGPVVA